jgi:hypothetical protein
MVAVKAIQKQRVQDYQTFLNEIEILKNLVSLSLRLSVLFFIRITQILSNCLKLGKQTEFAF